MIICGIYKITNKINNHCYIGQSINIHERWQEHKKTAFNPQKNSYNYPLYRAFRKYGIENFLFEIIEECDVDNLTTREQYYIKYYDTYHNGYNQTSGGEGYYNSSKPVYQYDLNGNFIKSYPSIAFAARELGISEQNIRKVCYKEHNTAGGFQWSTNPNDPPKKTSFGQGKRVYQYDINGLLINEYPSLAEASRATGISYSHLKRAIAGTIQTAGGYIWTRIERKQENV